MKNISKILCCFFGSLLFAGCETIPPADFSKLHSEAPKSILVLPALNNTTSVNAPEYFISTTSSPFANRGYYVYPAYMVRKTLEDNGLADAGIVHAADASRLGALFGCDAAMYITIKRWDTIYIVVSASTTVEFDYKLKSCKTNEVLWENSASMTYSPSNTNSGNALADLAAAAIMAAVQKAAPNYIPLAQQANFQAANFGPKAFPSGPYGLEAPKQK